MNLNLVIENLRRIYAWSLEYQRAFETTDIGALAKQALDELGVGVNDPTPVPPIMTIELFVGNSQNNSLWSGNHLGYPAASKDSEIGPYGCAVTAISNLGKWHGYAMTPDSVNADILKAHAFRTDQTLNLVDWPRLPVVYPWLTNYRRLDFNSRNPNDAEMNELRDRLKVGPVILKVDGIPKTTPLDEHFIVALGQNASGAIVVCDSWDGHNKPLTAFTSSTYTRPDKEAKAIWSIIYYDVALG